MPIRRYIAQEFRRPMARGLNRPFLIRARDITTSENEYLVVKSRAGYQNRPEAMLRELFALLLARRLNLECPEPVLVEFPKGFDWGASEHPEHADLIRRSTGWNFATIHLGDAWKPWTQGPAPRSISADDLETAYSFDALVQNSDREVDNPNLLWRGDQLAVLDFDKAFAFLRTHEHEARPWRKTLVCQNLERHCLLSHLPVRNAGEWRGKTLWENFEEWWQDRPTGTLTAEIAAFLSDPDLDLPRLESYASKLATGMEDFFSYLTQVTLK